MKCSCGCDKKFSSYSKKIKVRPNSPTRIPLHGNTGQYNVNWNGGTSEYPNHSLMKKIRKVKLIQTNGKCEDCGKKKKKLHVHHLDGTKTNHAINNLRVVCYKCHFDNYHKGRKGRKPMLFQGVPLKEIAKIAGTTFGTVRGVLLGGQRSIYFEEKIRLAITSLTSIP